MLSNLLETWSSVYANHAALRTALAFTHVIGLIASGGCAVTADLATITAARDGSVARMVEMQLLKRTHRIVVAGLLALFVSGVLLLAADADTYWYSRVFWIKMGLIALLLANGALLLAGERRVRMGDAREWTRLHYAAVSSLVLWSLTTLAGAALPNLG